MANGNGSKTKSKNKSKNGSKNKSHWPYKRAAGVITGALLGTAGLMGRAAYRNRTPVYATKNLITKPIQGHLGPSWVSWGRNKAAATQINALRKAGTNVKIEYNKLDPELTSSGFVETGTGFAYPTSYTYAAPSAIPSSYNYKVPNGIPLTKILGNSEWKSKSFTLLLCGAAGGIKKFISGPAGNALGTLCVGGVLAHTSYASSSIVQAILANGAIAMMAIQADAKRAEQEEKKADKALKKEGVNAAVMSAAALANASRSAASAVRVAQEGVELSHQNAEAARRVGENAIAQAAANSAAGRQQAANLNIQKAQRNFALAQIKYKQKERHHANSIELQQKTLLLQTVLEAKKQGIIAEEQAKQLLLTTLGQLAGATRIQPNALLGGNTAWAAAPYSITNVTSNNATRQARQRAASQTRTGNNNATRQARQRAASQTRTGNNNATRQRAASQTRTGNNNATRQARQRAASQSQR